MTHDAKVTVLICTWNRSALLAETLESLARMNIPNGLRWEVVIVDNNSSDNTRQIVTKRSRDFPTTLVYVFERRQGKSIAMNAGLEHARAPIVAFADDDVRFCAEWLTSIVEALDANPHVSYVGGPVNP